MNSKRCARCDAVLRYPEDADIKGTTIVDGSVCEVDVCGGCKEAISAEGERARMGRTLGIDDKSRRKFENMMVGYFGLRSVDDLYKLREIVEKIHEMFKEKEL